jgi:ComB9 competence protein
MSRRYCNKTTKMARAILMGGLFTSSVGLATAPLTSPMPTPPAQDLVNPLHENPDIEAQVKGKYPEMVRQESLPLGAIQHAWDQAGKGAGVYQLTYNPSEVVRLRCREMMATTIVFPKWERIEKVVVGDPGSFKTETPTPNIILIQPQEFTGVDSNMTAIGASGKIYSFYLRSEGFNTNHVSDLTVYIRVPQPAILPQPLKKGEIKVVSLQEGKLPIQEDYLEEVSFDPSKLNFNFDMAGDPEIAPERVFSDGIRTWFDYGQDAAKKDFPAVYAIIDGVDTPININREGTKLVAQSAGSFTLRAGQKVVCVKPTPVK